MQPILNHFTDNDAYLYALRDFIKTLHNVKRIEVLPYHSMGAYKWQKLGLNYTLNHIDSPTRERVENAERILLSALNND